MSAILKYYDNRHQIKAGDIILFSGNSLLAKAIRYFDDAYYTHIGIVFMIGNRRFICHSASKGAHPDFLSHAMRNYDDFCVVRLNDRNYNEVKRGIAHALSQADVGIKYDFLMLPRIAMYRKFNLDLKNLGEKDRDICSEFVRRFTDYMNIACYKAKNINKDWITPQDFIRFADRDVVSILYNDSIK